MIINSQPVREGLYIKGVVVGILIVGCCVLFSESDGIMHEGGTQVVSEASSMLAGLLVREVPCSCQVYRVSSQFNIDSMFLDLHSVCLNNCYYCQNFPTLGFILRSYVFISLNGSFIYLFIFCNTENHSKETFFFFFNNPWFISTHLLKKLPLCMILICT